MQVATVGKFNEKRPATKLTSIIVVMCLIIAIISSISLSLYVLKILNVLWPSIAGKILRFNFYISYFPLKTKTV